MQIEMIEIIEEFNNFDNNSDEYIDILLERGSSSWYFSDKDRIINIYIGEDGKIDEIEGEIQMLKVEKVDFIQKPKIIIKGEVILKKNEFDISKKRKQEISILITKFSNDTIGYYFTSNEKEINYGVQIANEVTILVSENNIVKGILIAGKFKIKNDRFYYEK